MTYLGFRASGFGFGDCGLVLRVQRLEGLGFGVWGLGFSVQV